MTPPPRLPDIHFRDDCLDAMPFRFRGEGALPCPFLAGNAAPECWHMGPDYAFVTLRIAETGDLVADTKRAYAELIGRVRASKHPYLIRIWNYFADINLGDEDAERYRQFCVGRAQAVDAAFNNPPPAATAIGSPRDDGRRTSGRDRPDFRVAPGSAGRRGRGRHPRRVARPRRSAARAPFRGP